MKRQMFLSLVFVFAVALYGHAATFQEDVDFLKQYLDVIVLKSPDGQAQVAVVPAYQGRVMTSTASGANGPSFGWINRELIASKKFEPHINAFGGEDRFWLGPEGGQFSIFFEAGAPFDLEHWQTPPVIDTVAYAVVEQSDSEVAFEHRATITNRSGSSFDVKIRRVIRLAESLTDEAQSVAFESENTITNLGDSAWNEETGMLSIWILGMFSPSPDATIVIPFREGSDEALGAKVNDKYFGKVPEDRLVQRDNVLFFSADGTMRSKIGISPKRATEWLGSYDSGLQALTLVQYTLPGDTDKYVNSMWELQEEPFSGDAINAYNDGPPSPGKKPMGPFYELESSSPAASLQPGESLTHIHRTQHLIGPKEALEPLAVKYLSAKLDDISSALPR
ncbi:MAG TPA: hypothetical protein PLQ42_00180 [Candidatus Hydrogenedentes bacterium]|nr:hypothetical protein [Candidatus Hydrogenedentota bacterium]HOM47693.1 hypothetical protein [Candidatus Hydrogenedentota bacterium]HOR49475.1 hypothetical protein [Candidatus Hydrogenedentota bacterium]HPK24385.1 hypothetical protein [Candidatus Hydrogenedentota bacterium]